MFKAHAALRATVVTLIGLVAYKIGIGWSAPMLNDFAVESYAPQSLFLSNRFGFFSLGIGAALTGFFAVELLSFIFPLFKRWRHQSFSGRRKLNLASLLITLALATWQSHQLVEFMTQSLDHEGNSLMVSTSLIAEVAATLFFVMGVAVLLILGWWMTRYGLGNGFGVIVVFTAMGEIANHIDRFSTEFMYAEQRPYIPGLLYLLLLAVALFRFLERKTRSEVTYAGTLLSYEHPSVPQGLFSIGWSASLILLPGLYFTQSSPLEGWKYVAAILVVFPLVSCFSYYITCSPRRVRQSLGGRINLPKSFYSDSYRNLGFAIFAVTLVWCLLVVPRPFGDRGTLVVPLVSLTQLIVVYFVSKDVIANWHFLCREPKWLSIGEFDNVHLMTVARSLLEQEGIPFLIKGYELRRLFEVINPLYKMQVLVPAQDVGRATALLDLNAIETI